MRQAPQGVNLDSPLINGGRRITVFFGVYFVTMNSKKIVFDTLTRAKFPSIKRGSRSFKIL